MPCDLKFQLQQITQPCNFQHDEQIFIHCYFLLLLMPEPLQYICPRFDTRRISQVIATYFKLNLFKKGCFHWYCTSGIWGRNIAMIYLLEWAPNNSFPMPKATFIELAIFSTQLLNFCWCLSDHWSRQKKLLWGWEVATDRPPPLALSSIMLREKRESHL